MRAMQGITVVGCGLDSGELLVARALGDAVADARLFATAAMGQSVDSQSERKFRAGAAPVIAARHAGAALDPAALVTEALDSAEHQVLIAAAPGGLLASLTEHYSNRDFARELGLPVVIAARAVGGVTGQVRLVAEAARAAGLAVAAIVLTGWPDPPNRVQLDERELLSKIVRAPVVTLSDASDGAAAGWPVADWLQAEAPPPEEEGSAAAPAAPINLDPYDAWQPHQVGDPRNTPRPQIMQTMLEIIDAEGPMTAMRAYSLYNRAAGGRKLTSVAKAPLSSAVYWLARENKVTLTREADVPWQGDDMVRLPDQPPVRVRELGPRSLDEVPLDEIAELVKLIRGAHGASDPTDLKRAVLSTYGLVRLTSRADEYLGLAIDLAS
ncbi:MAG TPA: AAA family ATPase [Thermoleophilaceae bacterium]|jgi:dethiobiotin synthetase|nr:AAA family ATPase [Thermoleophilaceae bacterium]